METTDMCPNCGAFIVDPAFDEQTGSWWCRNCGAELMDYGPIGTTTYADTQRTIQSEPGDILPSTVIRSKTKKRKDGEGVTNLDRINRMLQGQKTSQQDKYEKVKKKIKDTAEAMGMPNIIKEAQSIAKSYINVFPNAHVRNTSFAIAILFLISEQKNLFSGENLDAKLEPLYKYPEIEEVKKKVKKWIKELKKFLPEYNVSSSQKIEENVQTYLEILKVFGFLKEDAPYNFQSQVEKFVLLVKNLKNIKLPSEKMIILVSIFIMAKQKNLVNIKFTNEDKDLLEYNLKLKLELINKHAEKILEAIEKQKKNPQVLSECPSPPLTRRQIERKINERKALIKQKIDRAIELQKLNSNVVIDFDEADQIYFTDEDKEKIANIREEKYKPKSDIFIPWLQEEDNPFGVFGLKFGGSKKKTNKKSNRSRRNRNRCSCKYCR